MERQNLHYHDEQVIEPPAGWLHINWQELWFYRELLFFFVWRDLKVRYKQTTLGALWAVLQPFLSMILFSLVFGSYAKLPSNGLPYTIFSFTALLPWQLFSRALTDSSQSLVTNQHIIGKIYFPRIFLPLSMILSGLVDFGISLVVLVGMMVFYHINPGWNLLYAPLFLIMLVITAAAVGLWLSVLNAKFRDVKYAIPFLVQLWLYATPVAYSTSLVPENLRLFYGLNPMVGVVEGFRWAFLGQQAQYGSMIGVSFLIVILLLITGLIYFQRMEKIIADIV
jgi:lipopolysaccharide transport system permease protein